MLGWTELRIQLTGTPFYLLFVRCDRTDPSPVSDDDVRTLVCSCREVRAAGACVLRARSGVKLTN
jgi:hypothetical protein